MLGDYARAAAGLVPTAAALADDAGRPGGGDRPGRVCRPFCGLWDSHRASPWDPIEMTETVSSLGPAPASIRWSELDRMRLAYYSTRRDRSGGWMQLELRAGWASMRIDSRIEGFTELVKASARAAETRGLALDPATAANLEASGSSRGRRAACSAMQPEGGVTDLLQVRDLHVRFAAPGGVHPRRHRRVVPGAPAIDRRAGRRIRARASRSSARRSCASCRAAASSRRARSCSPIRGSTARSSTSRNCRATARRCGRSAAAGSRSSFRSR